MLGVNKSFNIWGSAKVLILFFLLLITLSITIYFKTVKTKVSSKSLDCKKNIETTSFFYDSPPLYELKKEDTDFFYKTLENSSTSDKFSELERFFQTIEKGSKEGFFVIVKHVLRRPQDIKTAINDWYQNDDNESAVVLVHEFTHSGQYPCFFENKSCNLFSAEESKTLGNLRIESYGLKFLDPEFPFKTSVWVDDESISYDYDISKLFGIREIYSELEASTNFNKRLDDTYVKDNSTPLNILLDEINAYTKSSRVLRELNCTEMPKQVDLFFYSHTLSRHLYYLSLYIEHSKNQRSDTWKYLATNREMTYLLFRTYQLALEEVGIVLSNYPNSSKVNKEPSIQGINTNLNLIMKRQQIFYDLLKEANIIQPFTKTASYRLSDLVKENINFKIFRY